MEMNGLAGLSRSELEHLIDEWIFSERDREILKRKLLDGITYEELAEEIGLSVRQTKNIVYKGKERLIEQVEQNKTQRHTRTA